MKQLKLIGVEEKNYRHLKKEIEIVLKQAGCKTPILEINDVEQILSYQLPSIPAILVDNEIIYQQNNHIPSTEEISKILNKKYLQSYKMKNIIVPTDFSTTAQNAFKYAQQLAIDLPAEIELIHSYYPMIDPSNPMNPSQIKYMIKAKQQLLNDFRIQNSIESDNIEGAIATNVDIQIKVLQGLASDTIVQQLNKQNVDMIVMGTTGDGAKTVEKLFGNVSTHIAKKSKKPVLFVPPNSKYNGFKNILYASNHKAADEMMIHEMINFASVFNADMHLLHVIEDGSSEYKIIKNSFEQMVKKQAPSLLLKSTAVKSNSIQKGIQSYTENNEIDLIVMATTKRSLIDQLLHKSVTRKMIFNPQIPLLILHFDF